MGKVIPEHIAIIPDGNRRWALQHKKKVYQGHEEGVKTAEDVLRAAFDAGVKYFTIWGASEGNLTKRSKIEVETLSRIFVRMLERLLKSKEVKKYNARIHVCGRFREILKNKKLNAVARDVEEKTKKNEGRVLTILLGYDGREEMLFAIKEIEKKKKEVSGESLEKELWTGHLPPVDLVIRTGGEPHWSAGFMMWLTANSELYFTKTLWPAFSKKELQKAFNEFSRRRRMMGA